MSCQLIHDFTMTPRQIVGLFLLCKRHESGLDQDLEDLYSKLRYFLYEHLSIYQIENLEMLYNDGVDFPEIEKEQ